MTWSTIYIDGRKGFKEAVRIQLKDTWMAGAPEDGHALVMYWLREDSTLRDFKLAIGSKIIFKYRLQFFASVDEYLQSQKKEETKLSKDENRLVRKMIAWQKGGVRIKPLLTKRKPVPQD